MRVASRSCHSQLLAVLALALSIGCAHSGGRGSSHSSSGPHRGQHSSSSGSVGGDLAVGLLDVLFSGIFDAMVSGAASEPPPPEVAVWSATFPTQSDAEQFQRALPEHCVLDARQLKTIEESAAQAGIPMRITPGAREGDFACALMQETDDSYSVVFGLAPEM